MLIDKNQLEDNISRYTKISLVMHFLTPCLTGTQKEGAWMWLGHNIPIVQILGNGGLIYDFVNKKSLFPISISKVIILMHNFPPERQLLKISSMHYYNLFAFTDIC
jgi:hypothetical protein